MASKYAAAVVGLPSLPPEDPSYQEKIEAIKKELTAAKPLTPAELATEYAVTRSVKDDLSEQLAIIQQRLTAVEQLLFKSFEDDEPGWGTYGAGPNMIKMPDGSSVAIQMEPTGKVEDREAFRKWCIANGLENSLQLHSATTISITKERLLNGEAAPDGVRAFVRPKYVWRKGNS